MSVDIKITVDRDEYQALVKIADRQQVNVHTLIEHLVRRALNPNAPTTPKRKRTSKTPELLRSVAEMNRQGFSDGDVAKVLGLHPYTAFRWRQHLGLAPAVGPGGHAIKKKTAEATNERQAS